MKKQAQKLFPIKNTFIYPSGKEDVVMTKSKPAQEKLEDDMRKVINLTEVKILHKKEPAWQWKSGAARGTLV